MLKWIENWYISHCNGEWEDYYGIKISTLDNPGWLVKIDISETELENRQFQEINVYKDDNDWLCCKLINNEFLGGGDPTKLNRIIEEFRRWAENN